VDAHAYRERPVDLADGLEDPRVAGLGEPLTAVFLGDVEAHEAALAELSVGLVGNPALVVDPARVDMVGGELAKGGDQPPDLLGLSLVGKRVGEDHVLVDLPEDERLGEARDGGRGGGHDSWPPVSRLRPPAPTDRPSAD